MSLGQLLIVMTENDDERYKTNLNMQLAWDGWPPEEDRTQ